MGVLASLSVLGVIVAWTACKERRKVVATIAIMLAVVDLVYGDPAAFRGSPGGRVQAKTAACAHMSEPPPAGNATTPAAAPPVQPVLQPKLQPELQPVLLKSPASELCPQKPCSALMDVRCSVGSSEALRRWVPDDLGALAVNGTVFLSVYRPSRDGPTDGRPPVLSDMWYNMLWFFSKAMPNASMLVGMPACPADGDVSPWFHHVTGEENYKPALKVGGPLPPKTVRCHPLPPPCDCPGGAMHARCKFALILAVLRRGYSVFWVDSDTALRGNPLATPFPEDADLIGCFERSFHINTGMLHIRPTQKAVLAFQIALESLHHTDELENAKLSRTSFGGAWLLEQAFVAQLFNLHNLKPSYPTFPLFVNATPYRGTYVAKALNWQPEVYPCRANNKKHLDVWRKKAQDGSLIGIHASGGCGRHLWTKKGWLIEMRAWYNASEVDAFFRSPRSAKLAKYAYSIPANTARS